MFQIALVADIWVVLVAMAAGQLLLQWSSHGRLRFHEGLPKLLQIATGVPALIVVATFMFDPDLPDGPLSHAAFAVTLVGAALFNAAAALILSSHLTLGDCWSGDLETKPDHRLVCSGPYRFVRHPLYSSYVMLTAGLFLMSGNGWLGAVALVYFLSVAARVPREEAMMVERLGAAYVAYQGRTGRFLPKFARTSRPSPAAPPQGAKS